MRRSRLDIRSPRGPAESESLDSPGINRHGVVNERVIVHGRIHRGAYRAQPSCTTGIRPSNAGASVRDYDGAASE